MRNGKKLVRGLKDISAFFTASGEVISAPADVKLEKSVDLVLNRLDGDEIQAEILKSPGLPEVHCFALFPYESHNHLLGNQLLLRELKDQFMNIYSLSISGGRAINSIENSVRQLAMPSFQIYDVLHPEPVLSRAMMPLVDSEQKVCVFFDPKSIFEGKPELLEILDKVILTVSANSADTMVNAYQVLSGCLQKNPTLHFSLFIEGSTSEELCETIYERFSRITSRFLGCGLDFLGCMDSETVQFNRDLLIGSDGSYDLIRRPMKIQLAQLLTHDLLLEVG